MASDRELAAYLSGASRDGTISRRHGTLRIAQSGLGWLTVLREVMARLGARGWIYQEGRRGVWVLETKWRHFVRPATLLEKGLSRAGISMPKEGFRETLTLGFTSSWSRRTSTISASCGSFSLTSISLVAGSTIPALELTQTTGASTCAPAHISTSLKWSPHGTLASGGFWTPDWSRRREADAGQHCRACRR